MSAALLLILVGCPAVGDAAFAARTDLDRDGHVDVRFGGDDCDDTDAGVAPGLEDAPYDEVDADCDGASDFDADGDGSDRTEEPGGDCDDTDASVFPGAVERCDGRDDDCDGLVPAVEADADADGALACDDCDDLDPESFPGAAEVCDAVGRDEDCDERANDSDPGVTGTTAWYFDDDGDGWGDPDVTEDLCGGPPDFVLDVGDCDDQDATVHPGVIHYADADGDGWGDSAASFDACEGAGVLADGDCDDLDPSRNPGAAEVCGGGDEDCDGLADTEDPEPPAESIQYRDADGDGAGWPDTRALSCDSLDGYVQDRTDCDDTSASRYPGAGETCDGADDDCDGWVDDDDVDITGQPTWYADTDADGWGDDTVARVACFAVVGEVARGGDCDPEDATMSPDADEVCGGGDEDCDGLTDDADPDVSNPGTWYADTDSDGWGALTSSLSACLAPAAYAPVAGDCDDGDDAVSPDGTEDCATAADDDCDGDDNDRDALGCVTRFRDADADGYGEIAAACTCVADAEWSAGTDDDCDDTHAAFHPGADPWCTDGADTDCDGLPDTCDLVTSALTLLGVAAGDGAGGSVAGAGDVDGDGLDDLLIGAPGLAGAGVDAGGAYLIYGGGSGTLGIAGADALFTAEAAGDRAGFSISRAGDVNGDGLGDVVIGAPYSTTIGISAGNAYVVLGPATGTTELQHADSVIAGESYTRAGYAVAGGGDLDGDGYDDVAIGAPLTIPYLYGLTTTRLATDGAVFVYFGPLSAHEYPSRAGAVIVGTSTVGGTGKALAVIPDADGDGMADLLVGAPGEGAGAAYLVTGQLPGANVELDDGGEARLAGETDDDEAGAMLASAGDVDGDGTADLLVGAPNEGTNGVEAGAVYVVLGTVRGDFDLADAHATIRGEAAGDNTGTSLAGLGDLDGDGADDIAIGAPGADHAGAEAGATWVLYGPFAGRIDITTGERVERAAGDGVGSSLSAAGDVDGDGTPDLIVGGPDNDDAGADAGAAWLLPGSAP